MTVRVVTPPTGLLVSLPDMKQHLRVLHSEDDARLTAMIGAATETLEATTQRRFLTQGLEWVLTHWLYPMRLPVAGVDAESVEITYADEVLGALALPEADYVVRPSGETVAIFATDGSVWPVLDPDAAERVVIAFDVDPPPETAGVAEACKLMVEYLYRAHDWPLASSGLPLCVETMIRPYRWS